MDEWMEQIKFVIFHKITITVTYIITRKKKQYFVPILIYYTLRFYFPYLSLLAQPVTIFVYGPVVYGPARYLHYFR
jgi:hypothetical protein